MRILLTGGSGQLGRELQKHRAFIAPSHDAFNLNDANAVRELLDLYSPDLILHVAAYTDTITPDIDPMAAFECFQTNVMGTRNLVESAKCPIIYISTESVYHPYNFYILTKMQGEIEVSLHKYGFRIIRTSFRDDPFEYPKACTDMYTIGDTVGKIAELINEDLDKPVNNEIVNLGTGVKTVYELAKRSRPDVMPVKRENISLRLPKMEELCLL